jgi:hypothetical protein
VSELHEIRTVFQGLETLYQTHLPKVDPALIHDLLIQEQQKSERAPFYMVELFTSSKIDSEVMKERIYQTTGMLPAIYDSGTHYVTNQRLTLDILKEISASEDVFRSYRWNTGTLTGRGASHEPKEHKH